MPTAPRHTTVHDLEVEHREDARRSELICLDELEQRRRKLAEECSSILQRARLAARG
jgi:hypothetical protein